MIAVKLRSEPKALMPKLTLLTTELRCFLTLYLLRLSNLVGLVSSLCSPFYDGTTAIYPIYF